MNAKQKQQREARHTNCTLVICAKETRPKVKTITVNNLQYKLPQSIPRPIYGLYCKEHGFWFKWINEDTRQMLVNKFKVPVQ